MFLAPSHSDLGESLPTINLLGVYLGELAGKTPTVSEDFGFGDGFSPESELGRFRISVLGAQILHPNRTRPVAILKFGYWGVYPNYPK